VSIASPRLSAPQQDAADEQGALRSRTVDRKTARRSSANALGVALVLEQAGGRSR
jgi:hypothetical protein